MGTEASMTDTSKLTSKKASIFSKLFDPSKFKSHSQVKSVPDYPPPQYTPEEEAEAYYDPALTTPVPRLWIVRDSMGISQREVKDLSAVVEISDAYASFNEKGKVVWEYQNQGRLADAPIWRRGLITRYYYSFDLGKWRIEGLGARLGAKQIKIPRLG